MNEREQIALEVMRAAVRYNEVQEELTRALRDLGRALERRREAHGYQIAVCGTPAGYRRHQRAAEPPCYACQAGMTWDKRRYRT